MENMEKDNKTIDFESAMSRLEKITEELAREGVKLEEALSLYEEHGNFDTYEIKHTDTIIEINI